MANRTGCRSCTESTQCPSCRRRQAPMSPIGMQFMQAAADTTTATDRRMGYPHDTSPTNADSYDTGAFCGE